MRDSYDFEKLRSAKEIKRDIDKKLKEGKLGFEMAPVVKVTELEDYIQDILEAIDHEEAFVTDESQLSDFLDVFGTMEDSEIALEELSNTLDIEIYDELEKIVDIAQRLKDKKNGQKE